MSEAALIAYHGDPKIKEKYLRRVRAHRKADELIRGISWDGHKGCAVGCTLEKYDHQAYETELGIPEVIAHLEDAIFEGLPGDEAMQWPERFLKVIRPGADLGLVSAHFFVWLLDEELRDYRTPETEAVVALYRRTIAGERLTTAVWAQAAAAALAAADAADAAQAAVDAAWAARAAVDAEETSYSRMANKLIGLLEAA